MYNIHCVQLSILLYYQIQNDELATVEYVQYTLPSKHIVT